MSDDIPEQAIDSPDPEEQVCVPRTPLPQDKRDFKLGIVIPLKSSKVSSCWHTTSKALASTIQSIENQRDRDFVVIVVGHEEPVDVDLQTARFHSIEIPIPPLKSGGSYAHRSDFDRILDKNRKIVRGMQLLSDAGVTHWFYLDADDLIDCDFVSHIKSLKLQRGCILDGGYLIYKRRKLAIPTAEISSLCGSTSILADSIVDIPSGLEASDLNSIAWCRYAHSKMDSFFQESFGERCLHVETRLIGYVLEHGDNCSDEFRHAPAKRLRAWLKPLILGRRYEGQLSTRFGTELS